MCTAEVKKGWPRTRFWGYEPRQREQVIGVKAGGKSDIGHASHLLC